MSIPSNPMSRANIESKGEDLIITASDRRTPIKIPLKQLMPAQLTDIQNILAQLKTLEPEDKTRMNLIKQCEYIAGVSSSSSSSTSSSASLWTSLSTLLSPRARSTSVSSSSSTSLVIPSRPQVPLPLTSQSTVNTPSRPLVNVPLPTPYRPVSVSSNVMIFDNGKVRNMINSSYLWQAFAAKQAIAHTLEARNLASKTTEVKVLREPESNENLKYMPRLSINFPNQIALAIEANRLDNDQAFRDFKLFLEVDYISAAYSFLDLLDRTTGPYWDFPTPTFLINDDHTSWKRLLKEMPMKIWEPVNASSNDTNPTPLPWVSSLSAKHLSVFLDVFADQFIYKHDLEKLLRILRPRPLAEIPQIMGALTGDARWLNQYLALIKRLSLSSFNLQIPPEAFIAAFEWRRLDFMYFLEEFDVPSFDSTNLLAEVSLTAPTNILTNLNHNQVVAVLSVAMLGDLTALKLLGKLSDEDFKASLTPAIMERIITWRIPPHKLVSAISRAMRHLKVPKVLDLLGSETGDHNTLLNYFPDIIPRIFTDYEFSYIFIRGMYDSKASAASALMNKLSDEDFQSYFTRHSSREFLYTFEGKVSSDTITKIKHMISPEKMWILLRTRDERGQMIFELLSEPHIIKALLPEYYPSLIQEPWSDGLSYATREAIAPNFAWLWEVEKASTISLSEEEFKLKCKQTKQLMINIERLLRERLSLVDADFFARKKLSIADDVPRAFDQLVWFAEGLIENIANRMPLLGTPPQENQDAIKKFYDEMLMDLEECLQFITYDLRNIATLSGAKAKSAIENSLNNLLILVSAKTEGRCAAGVLADLAQLKGMLTLGRSQTELQTVRAQIVQNVSTSTSINVNEGGVSPLEFSAKEEVKEAKEREVKEAREEVKLTHQDSMPYYKGNGIQEVFYRAVTAAIEDYARLYNGRNYDEPHQFIYRNGPDIRTLYHSGDAHLIAQLGYLTGLRKLPDALFIREVICENGSFRYLNDLVKLDFMNVWNQDRILNIVKDLSNLDHVMLTQWFEDNNPPSFSDARLDATMATEREAQAAFSTKLASLGITEAQRNEIVRFCSAVSGACLPPYTSVSDKMRDHLRSMRKTPKVGENISAELDRLIDGVVERKKNPKGSTLTNSDLLLFLKENGLATGDTYSIQNRQKDVNTLIDNAKLKNNFKSLKVKNSPLGQVLNDSQLEQVLIWRNEFNRTLQLWANDQEIEFDRNVDGLPSRGLQKQLLKGSETHIIYTLTNSHHLHFLTYNLF